MKKVITLFMLLFLAMMKTVPTYASDLEITGPDEIFKQVDRYLVMSDILTLYSTPSGDIDVTDDAYTGYGDIPGIYEITLCSTDDAVPCKQVDINVRNTIGEVIAVTRSEDLFTIHVNKDVSLSTQNIREILQNVQMIQVSSTTILQEITNTYKVNKNSPGNYMFEFRLISLNGIEEFHTISIRVSNDDQLVPDDVIEPSPQPKGTLRNGLFAAGFIIVIVGVMLAIKSKKSKKRG